MSARPGLTRLIHELNEEARFFVQHSIDIMLRLDADGRIGWVNPAWTYWLLWEAGEVVGRPLLEFVHPDDLALFTEAVRTLTTAPLIGRTRFRLLKRSGGEREFGVRGSDFNTRKRAYLTLREVSLQRAYERQLEDGRRYFEALLDHALIGVARIDERGAILYQSPASRDVLGYESVETTNRNVFDFVEKSERARFAATFTKLLVEPDGRRRIPSQWKHADGSIVPVVIHMVNKLHDPILKAIIVNYWRTDRPLGFE